MKITVSGSGFVGPDTGTCLAEVGVDALSVDVDEKDKHTEERQSTSFRRNDKGGTIRQGGSYQECSQAVEHGLYQFIAVGASPDEDGSGDLQYVLDVAKSIGNYMQGFKVIINKSNVPVGTVDKDRETVSGILASRRKKS